MHPGSFEIYEYELRRGAYLVARSLGVIAIARLMPLSWCVLGFGGCFLVLQVMTFQIRVHIHGAGCERPGAVIGDSVKRLRLPFAHRALAATYPHPVYPSMCSHPRIVASSVDQ